MGQPQALPGILHGNTAAFYLRAVLQELPYFFYKYTVQSHFGIHSRQLAAAAAKASDRIEQNDHFTDGNTLFHSHLPQKPCGIHPVNQKLSCDKVLEEAQKPEPSAIFHAGLTDIPAASIKILQ